MVCRTGRRVRRSGRPPAAVYSCILPSGGPAAGLSRRRPDSVYADGLRVVSAQPDSGGGKDDGRPHTDGDEAGERREVRAVRVTPERLAGVRRKVGGDVV